MKFSNRAFDWTCQIPRQQYKTAKTLEGLVVCGQHSTMGVTRGGVLRRGSNGALARIIKLPIIFERIPIQNGTKWAKIV